MSHIRTYCRLKPTDKPYEHLETTENAVVVRIPDSVKQLSVSASVHSRVSVRHEFQYSRIFGTQTDQEEVFNNVAKEIVLGFLSGYNGTIFAYGQTGSGKTYTMEGSARRYADRGLASRALSMIYTSLQEKQEEQQEITVHVSYLEIYQEVGYDLLNPTARTGVLVTSFPKVAVVEGPGGSCLVRNLTQHLAATEDVAQSLLLQGQANRKVAETPMNLRSSRSHAVLTVQLSLKKHDDDVITRSKLHLVDLAGSERVAKTGVEGQQLFEAKYINLSLLYLEGVIVALQQARTPGPAQPSYNRWVESMRPSSAHTGGASHAAVSTHHAKRHVPYRNSLLTMVLRDSLGGNCQTAMIATISVEQDNLGETLSTCRFAQRVACITNVVSKNEEVDDKVMIRRLRRRIAELEADVALMREGQEASSSGDVMSSKLTDEEKANCVAVMQAYVAGKLKDPVYAGITNLAKFRECLRLIRKLVLEHFAPPGTGSTGAQARRGPPLAITAQEANPRSKPVLDGRIRDGHVTRSSANHVNSATGSEVPDSDLGQDREREDVRRAISSKSEESLSNVLPPSGNQERRNRASSANRAWSAKSRDEGKEAAKTAREVYKSPFEKRKEQEIGKLERKVERSKEMVKEQQQQLQQTQASIQLQELQLLRSELGMKLESTREQLQDQHSYVQRLKRSGSSQTDPDFLQQEKLVAKQLKKRQARIERRLTLVEDQISLLSQQKENEPDRSVSVAPSGDKAPAGSTITETFSTQHSRRDGHMNTRQVLDALQVQERQQKKAEASLEKEKILTMSKEMEVKEAATRQKLQEFKDKLKQAKLNQAKPRLNTNANASMGDLTEKSKSAATTLRGNEQSENLEDYLAGKQLVSQRTSSASLSGEGHRRSGEQSNPTSSNFTAAEFTDRVAPFGGDMHRTSAFKPVQSDSSESAPPPATAHKSKDGASSFLLNITKSAGLATGKMGSSESLHATHAHAQKRGVDRWADGYSLRGSRQSLPQTDDDKNEVNRQHAIVATTSVDVAPVDVPGYEDTPRVPLTFTSDLGHGRLGNHTSSSRVIHRPDPVIAGSESGLFSSPQNAGLRSDSESANFNGLREALKDHKESRQKSDLQSDIVTSLIGASESTGKYAEPDEDLSDVLEAPPGNDGQFASGYDEEDFDEDFEHARRMDLSKKSFDEALQRMLQSGHEPQGPVSYHHKDYNQFARVGGRPMRNGGGGGRGYPGSKPSYSSSSKMSSTGGTKMDSRARLVYGATNQGFDPPKKTTPVSKDRNKQWDTPESKNLTVSDRVTQYLEESQLQSKGHHKPGKSYTDDDVPMHRSHSDMDAHEAPPREWNGEPVTHHHPHSHVDVDSYTPKIRAYQETEREEAFMRSAQEQKDRVARIRKAQKSAALIQKAWRTYNWKKYKK